MTDVTTEYSSIWTELAGVEFKHGWLDADGIRTRYIQAGPTDGPPLIMLHGTGGSLETFCRNFRAFAQTYNCVAYDMLGTGFSDKPDIDYEIPTYCDHLLAVMDALNIQRASFIGVSLGSWIAVRFAHDYPERTNKIILISPAGLFNDSSNMARIREHRMAVVADPTWDKITAVIRNLVEKDENCIPDIVANRQAFYRLPEMGQAMEHILILQDPDVRGRNNLTEDEWKAIGAETLAILGVDHPDMYLETGRLLPGLMRSAITADMPQTGHWPHFEDSERFNEIGLEFLASSS